MRLTNATIKSYQADQCVFVNGAASTFLPVTSGVVKRSIFGPLLFSLFIDDICSQITACHYHTLHQLLA
jgi:hypothetical protein